MAELTNRQLEPKNDDCISSPAELSGGGQMCVRGLAVDQWWFSGNVAVGYINIVYLILF